MEQIESARALRFIKRQNYKTLQTFGGAAFERERDALASIYDPSDSIPYISRRGGYLYNLWKDANNPRGLWRRTTLEDFRTPRWFCSTSTSSLTARVKTGF
ncbi:S9 family peptidase (plasmid) [Bradyrhizobium sp. 187]|nr:S9 family peptidase [Bradyrhizobium sp. 187]